MSLMLGIWLEQEVCRHVEHAAMAKPLWTCFSPVKAAPSLLLLL